jgi:hypothetical protein
LAHIATKFPVQYPKACRGNFGVVCTAVYEKVTVFATIFVHKELAQRQV